MYKISRIRQEIERLKETHEKNLDKPMERGRIGHAHGYVDCCDELLSFLDTLSEEPDKSLEEAAEEYNESMSWAWEAPNHPHKSAFIAGAEWQKAQMMKEAVEGEAEELYNDGESQCTVGVGTYFKPGEKVYVLKTEEKNK